MTVAITDVVLRDAHQSLFATRLRLDDMLPVAAQLDDVGYRSLECWGGATFDACIRFLGEDPWVRLRELKKAMPKTPLQMLLRGQNLLGYRHYADDVVERFVERAVKNGMDVFRVFDAMNDPRNMQAALQAVRRHGAHAQGTLSYTTSPAHTLQTWLDLTEQLLETGVDSVAIKDMSGILTPHAAFELVSEIKKRYDVTLHLHCHATTGMAEMALLKAIEARVDGVDTAISSMSATYGHPPPKRWWPPSPAHRTTPASISTGWRASPRTSARCAKIPRLRRPAERHRQPYPRRPVCRRGCSPTLKAS